MASAVRTLLLILNIALTACTFVEEFRKACPYTNFCTIPSLRTFNGSNDVNPCCYDCFCDEDCWAYGDCCPDLDVNYTSSRGLSVKLECKPAYLKNNFTNSPSKVSVNLSLFLRMIEVCPKNYSHEDVVSRMCSGNYDVLPDYDDVVPVSDGKSRIFKNKHCALCHGVTNFTRWRIHVQQCTDKLTDIQLTLSEARSYFLNNCFLSFERPPGVPLNGRTLSCDHTTSCTRTDVDDSGVIEACQKGPNMPYVHVVWRNFGLVFKNVMCFKCEGNETNTCPNYDPDEVTKVNSHYKVYINPRATVTELGNWKQSECGEDELYDPYKKACRKMFCPPFKAVSYGRCLQVIGGVSNLYQRVDIVFPFDSTNFTLDAPEERMFNDSLSIIYSRALVKRFGFVGCEVYRQEFTIWYEIISKKAFAIVGFIEFKNTKSCNLQNIGEMIRNAEHKKQTMKWFLNGEYVDLTGRVIFFEHITHNASYREGLLIHSNVPKPNKIAIKRFFLCRFFILSVDEYKARVEQNGYDEAVEGSKLSFTTRMLPGYYAVSENEVAVCVDTYLSSSATGSASFVLKIMIGIIITLHVLI